MGQETLTVLFVDHASGWGGAEHSLFLLLTHLDRSRIRPHLAGPEGPLLRRVRQHGLPVHPLTLPRLRKSPWALRDLIRGGWDLARLARAVGAHILYANTVRAALYTAAAAPLAARPFVWHMRDFWLSERPPRFSLPDRWGKGLLCARARRVIANSRATAAHLPCPDKITVVPNGVDFARYVPGRGGATFRRRYRIPRDVPLIGTVGRLRPWKGQDRFLRVLARVRREIPHVWGVIVGGTPLHRDDAYLEHLRAETRRLGLEGWVVFTGHLEDVRPALDALDLLVHPGDPEPFGMAVLEAMAMATPVVAFAHGALPDIVESGTSGLLVPPGDEEALARGIIALLRDDAYRKRLARGARERAATFTIERTAHAIGELLLSLPAR